MANEFVVKNGLIVSGSVRVSGSVTAQSFTGSFSGSLSAPGSNTQVIYNSGGNFAAEARGPRGGGHVVVRANGKRAQVLLLRGAQVLGGGGQGDEVVGHSVRGRGARGDDLVQGLRGECV